MALKKSIVTPILKKPNLDADDLENYRPISNLPFIGKLLEKVVTKRLSAYLDGDKLLPVISMRIGAFIKRKRHFYVFCLTSHQHCSRETYRFGHTWI